MADNNEIDAMAAYTVKDALAFTLRWEGGYTNDSDDLGGATHYGVTQSTYDAWRVSKSKPKQPVKGISMQEVYDIYEERYWIPSRAKWLQRPLALAMFDTAVNFGVAGAIRRLQAALKVPVTGQWTDATSNAVHSANQQKLAMDIVTLRIAHRNKRVAESPSQQKFLKGWLNRDNALAAEIGKMTSHLTILTYGSLIPAIEPDDDMLREVAQEDEERTPVVDVE